MGFNTFACIGSGIVSSYILGRFAGTAGTVQEFLDDFMFRVRHLLGWNAVLCLLGNAALSDEMAQIVTIGPVIKQITDDNVYCANEKARYKLSLRNATFGDAMGVFGSQLIPWHVYLGFYVGIAAAVYPVVAITQLDIIKFNFMAMIAVASLLILTFTGLDRIVPLFAMPREPEVQLKKNMKTEEASA